MYLRWLLLLLLLPAALPAAGQSCTHYLSATDGADRNAGTSPAAAVQSFEYAVRTFPTGAVVCMTAGEYFRSLDGDGIQLEGLPVQDKQMTFIVQPFAGSSTILFSEDAFLADLGSGSVTFQGGIGRSVVFGTGSVNTPDKFPGNTNFLHTLTLRSGTVDLSDVSVTMQEAVGNPSYRLLQNGTTLRTAPAEAAIVRGGGRLLAPNLTWEAAPRVLQYTGHADRTTGHERPPSLGGGRLRLALDGGTLTFPGALTLAPGERLLMEGGGTVRVADRLTLTTAAEAPLYGTPTATGRLELAGGFYIQTTPGAAAGLALLHEGPGTILASHTTARLPPGAPTGLADALIRQAGSGIVATGPLQEEPVTGGRRPRLLLHSLGAGTLIAGQAGQSTTLYGNLHIAAGARMQLDGPFLLHGSLQNAGTLTLATDAMALPGGGTYVNEAGAVIAAPAGGGLRLTGTAVLQGTGVLPTVEAVAGTSALQAARLEGDLILGGSSQVRLQAPGTISGSVTVRGTARLEVEAALRAGGDVLLEGGRMVLADTLAVTGRLEVGAGATLEAGRHVLDLQGSLVEAGGTVALLQATLRAVGGGTVSVHGTSATPLHVGTLVVSGAGTTLQTAHPVRVEALLRVEAEATLQLDGRELQLVGDGARVICDGYYRGGRLVLADPAANEVRQRLEGGGTYGDLTIRLADAADRVVVAAPHVTLSGTLTLDRGGLDLAGRTLDFSDRLGPPALMVHLPQTPLAGPILDTAAAGAGRLNPSGTPYTLQYRGTLATPHHTGRELHAGPLAALTFTTIGTALVDQPAAVGGPLHLHRTARLNLQGHPLTLTGQATHTVAGRILGGVVRLTGGGRLAGTPQGPAVVERLEVATTDTLTIADLLQVRRMSVERGLVQLHLPYTGGAAVLDTLVMPGGRLQLTAPVAVGRRLEMRGGALALGSHDLVLLADAQAALLTLSSAGTLPLPPSSTEASTQEDGALVLVGGGQQVDARTPVVHLRLALSAGRTATLLHDLAITGRLENRSGTLDLAGHTLTLYDVAWRHEGGDYGRSGTVSVAGAATLTLAAPAALPALHLTGPQAGLQLLPDTAGAGMPLTVHGLLRMEAGILALGPHDLHLKAPGEAFRYQGGSLTATGGALVFDGGPDQRFTATAALTLPRMHLLGDVTFASPGTFTVTQRLALGRNGSRLHFTDADSNVRLGPAARLVREGPGTVTRPPLIGTDGLHLVYAAPLTTGAELPASLATLTLDAGEGTVTLTRDVTVRDTLALRSGTLQAPAHAVTLAPAATLLRVRGTLQPDPTHDVLQGTAYTLHYLLDGDEQQTDDQLFPSDSTVHRLVVAGTGRLRLHAPRSVDTLAVRLEGAGSLFDLNGQPLRVRHVAAVQSGLLTSRNGGASFDVDGSLNVGTRAAVTRSPDAQRPGGVRTTAAGPVLLSGVLEWTELRLLGDLQLTPTARLGERVELAFLGGPEQTFTLGNSDRDAGTVDASVYRLTVYMAPDARITRGPVLRLLAPGETPFLLHVDNLHLDNGLLQVAPGGMLRLPGDARGFTRTDTPDRVSHVVGRVARRVMAGQPSTTPVVSGIPALGTFEFPVGAGYPQALYRPLTLHFTPEQPARTDALLVAEHVHAPPAGLDGLPLDAGDGTLITDTAPFYWQLLATPGLDPQPYTLEITATGFDAFAPDRLDDLRVLRRGLAPGAPFRLLGAPADYANQLVDVPQPQTPVLRVTTPNGSLTAAGTRFTVGVETGFTQYSDVQFVHNMPELTLQKVDVYVDGRLVLDDFTYRQASPLLRMGSGNHTVAVTPAARTLSDSIFSAVLSLRPGRPALAVASGVRSPDGYPTPSGGRSPALHLFVHEMSAPAEAPGHLPLTLFHGVIDAPGLRLRTADDLFALTAPGYGSFATYAPIAAAPHTFILEDTSTSRVLGRYDLSLAPYAGPPAALLLSGFLNAATPAVDLTPLLVLPDGTVVNLTAQAVGTAPAAELPATFALRGNYPNPFNPTTTITFDLPAPAEVGVELFDLLGRRVLVLPARTIPAGAARHLPVDAAALASGVYFYRLTARMATETQTATGRMMLTK